VIEIEDHRASDGSGAGGEQGAVETGAGLAQEQAWFASLAQAFKGNPYVWLGTNNEPPGPGGALAQWIATTYQTVRSNGFTSILMMDAIGAFDTTGMPQNFASSFTNVVWDAHYYGWLPQSRGVSTDVGLQQEISALQEIQSSDGVIPVIVAEFGPSTSGMSPDANGNDVVESVVRSAATSPQTTRGNAAWHWGQTDCCNNITIGGQITSPFGAAIALYIGTDPTATPDASMQTAPTPTSCTVASTTIALAQTPSAPAATPDPTPAPAAPATAPSPTVDPATEALQQSDLQNAAALIQQAETAGAQATNALADPAIDAAIASANAMLQSAQALRKASGE
jgi:hypothetical protein